jgi:hypothetical protein
MFFLVTKNMHQMICFCLMPHTRWTLDPTLVLNAGTVYRGTPLPDFPIFAPYMLFLAIFFFKIGIYDLNLV